MAKGFKSIQFPNAGQAQADFALLSPLTRLSHARWNAAVGNLVGASWWRNKFQNSSLLEHLNQIVGVSDRKP
jgi:hypothetical protein